MSNKRNDFLDYMKGCLTLIVVWWHCTTALWGGTNIFNAKTFSIAFGMPLFMGISGYLLCLSINNKAKPTIQLIFDKVLRVLIPCLIWETIISIYKYPQFLTIWYLWAYFVCSIVLIVCRKIVRNDVLFYIALAFISVGMFLVPYDIWFLSWMFLPFALGYSINGLQIKITEWHIALKLGIIAAYIVLCFFSKYDYTVYVFGSSYTLHPDFFVHCFRTVYSVVGSFAAIFVMHWLYSVHAADRIHRWICRIGSDSLGIYVIHTYIVIPELKAIAQRYHFRVFFENRMWLLNYILAPIAAIVMILACMLIIYLLRKTKITSLLLLGEKKKTQQA